MRPKPDMHKDRLAFIISRINEINEWRNEAAKHAINEKQRAAVDARALELRQAAERQ